MATSLVVHEGDVIADATLKTCGGLAGYEIFKDLYGLPRQRASSFLCMHSADSRLMFTEISSTKVHRNST